MIKRKILAISDFGNSGISESARYPLLHWHNQGHEVFHLALGYSGCSSSVDAKMYPWRDRLIPIFPRNEQTKFGQCDIRHALEMSGADVLFTTFDVWMTAYINQPHTAAFLDERTKEALSHQSRKFTHIMYFPLDGLIQGKYLPLGMDDTIFGADIPVTYSKFAQNAVKFNTNIDIPFIPIPHNADIYKPMNKKECRREMNFPENAFIIGMVGTNQYRKSWGEFFEAVVPFAHRHKDVYIAPWTTWNNSIMGGAEIRDYIYRSGLQERIIDPTQIIGSLSDNGMALLYNSFDLTVLATVGEGCGLPPLRSRACGVPALVTNHTSNTEFTVHEWERIKIKAKYYDNFGSNIERYLTDVDDLSYKLELFYNDHYAKNHIGQLGLMKMQEFEVDRIMPMWDEILESIPVKLEVTE